MPIFRIPIIERYVMRQIAIPLLTALGAGLTVLCAERIVRVLDITLGNRNSFGVVIELLAYWMPHYIGLAAPVALYLGLLFGFSKMSRDSELDAFLAAGVSLGRLTRPVTIIAVLLALNAVVMFGWIQPYSLYAYRATVHTLSNVDVFYLAEEGVFMQSGKRVFILDKLSRRDNAFQRIFLYEDRGRRGSETVTAASGTLVHLGEKSRPALRLFDGHRLELDRKPATGGASQPNESVIVGDFETADIKFDELANSSYRKRGINIRELTLPELYAELHKAGLSEARRNRATSLFHKNLALVCLVLVLPFLALPYAIGARRGHRAYRFAIAVILLIAYHEILQQGALLTSVSGISVVYTIWLPFAAFAGFALWRFHVVCNKLPRPWLDPMIEEVADYIQLAWRRLRSSGAKPS